MLGQLTEWLWDHEFWLPPNITWTDLEDGRNGARYARFGDMSDSLAAAIAILVLKLVVEKWLLRRLGVALGLKDRRGGGAYCGPPPHPSLEAAFVAGQRLDSDTIASLARSADVDVRKAERWLRSRALRDKASKLDKFAESAWKALCYGMLYSLGWAVLWDKDWFWHITACWHRYPLGHDVTPGVYAYYMAELGFYFSLLLSQFSDVRRSDFWEMFAHHVATIALLALSWTCNLFRVGTLVIWVHDCADVFLESAKMLKYVGWEKPSDALFYAFAISWVVTRLGYFPTWILYSISVEAGQFIQYFPAYYVFSLLLSVLLILDLFWFYFIAKVAYLSSLHPDGKIERDLRSESNSSD